ncbi:hypothetical protein G4Y73_03865 [Wenzhouxiangella sp. XN201]|uniref:hypothetical protein n=1 Tax=Wenzhouxiangella sp. XN201 TaxID=2710755 RepID=UPI0013C6FE1B|nr:hypothetical protein [Wenzhouxiangella sp. XN201]NEZ03283.1 hypothetical protein [Wenzhouxiangella sp. XN201]
MNGNDFSFSVSASSGGAASEDSTRYLAPPYNARLIDQQTVSLLISGTAQARELPLSLVQVLSQCGRFRTLDEHAREVARSLQLPPPRAAEIRRSLDQLVELDLLHSESDVLARLANRRSKQSQRPIEILFVRSCGRPATLGRLLESLAARSLPDGLSHCLVLDDSRDADERTATRSVISDFEDRLDGKLRLVDVDQRRRLIEAIAAQSGVEAESLHWVIEGDPDDPAPSYGASLNLALLLGAGSRIAIMDDDASFDAFELPNVANTPAFRCSQSARIHFPEPDWTLPGDHYQALGRHPLSCHDELLGATGGDLAALGQSDQRGLLEDLDPQLLHELSGETRVRMTSSGTLGDPGTGSILWLLAEDPVYLQPLCESESRYRELIGQRRLARCADRPLATTAYALMTTTLTGIDNRALLLPTQARGANEDLLFGALIDFLHPGSLQVGLPHMLFHLRPEPRRWETADIERPRNVERGGFLARQIEQLAQTSRSRDPERRADLLTAALRDLARCDDLDWRLKRELLETRADLIERIGKTRQSLKPPPWLDRDFARSLKAQRSITDQDEERLNHLAASLPAFLESYAASLPHWRRAWQSCQSLNLADLLDSTQ